MSKLKGVLTLSWLALLSSMSVAEMPRIDLTAGIYRIDSEVAFTDPMRQQGLMHRQSMPLNQGMLFVFPVPARHCMWMRNTNIPLSVAFLDREGKILNVEDMQPHTETSHCAVGAATYALEMNIGWFAQRGLGKGKKIAGVEKAPAPR